MVVVAVVGSVVMAVIAVVVIVGAVVVAWVVVVCGWRWCGGAVSVHAGTASGTP